MQHYHSASRDQCTGVSKPDISPDPIERWRISMKNLILAAVAALTVGASVAASAQGLPPGMGNPQYGAAWSAAQRVNN
jgi:chorismate synthase